jgi:hypothetical protein
MPQQNPLKGPFDFICKISKAFSKLYPVLPLMYTVLTIIFIILGIVGIIAFALGQKFKNLARTIYAFVYFITSFLNMLIIFHATYCSLVIPTREKTEEVPPATTSTAISSIFNKINKPMEGGKDYPIISKILTKIFDFINNIIQNNNAPFIIMQVLSTCLIVIVTSFMSVIFGGISKAGYEMHCTESNQVFSVPWLGKIVDFFMHLLLLISSIFLVFYSFGKLIFNSISAVGSLFGFSMGSASQSGAVARKVMREAQIPGDVVADVSQAINDASMFMNEWPVMRAAFIISLSYYIIQLILEMFKNIISNNIVLLTSWKTTQTECSDEPNKKSKTEIERGLVLFGNILLFILLVVITIGLIYVHIQFGSVINQGLELVHKFYPTASAQIGVPLTFEGVKASAVKVAKEAGVKIDVDNTLRQLEKGLTQLGVEEDFKLDDIKNMIKLSDNMGKNIQTQLAISKPDAKTNQVAETNHIDENKTSGTAACIAAACSAASTSSPASDVPPQTNKSASPEVSLPRTEIPFSSKSSSSPSESSSSPSEPSSSPSEPSPPPPSEPSPPPPPEPSPPPPPEP